MNKILSIKNLSVQYGNNLALENVNIDFYSNDFVGIIGPNGGGKSTLVKAILHLVDYTGEVIYLNRLNKTQIGYMPQNNQFDHHFPIKVEELILSGLQSTNGIFHKYNTRKAQLDICQAMQTMQISHLSNKAISELSGGELQRVLLCRAIINHPRLLILDEPTNFVDNDFEGMFYVLLQELNKEMAIIMVSHDLGTISSVVKSIVCVNQTAHRHDTNTLTPEMFDNYHCPIQMISHGTIPHTVLSNHNEEGAYNNK